MPPQTTIKIFKPQVQKAFEQYPNISHKAGKLLMNATRRTVYLQFFSDSDRKIVERDKHENPAFTTKNVNQSMSFVLIIEARSFMLVREKKTLPDRKHLFTMRLILLLEFTAREDITDTKKILTSEK